jgi:hypothetical protein
LVTCIFLNRTPAARARRFLLAFLEEYPTPEDLRDADPRHIRREYFASLGLKRRADWLVEMASQLIDDPPVPDVMRQKSYQGAGYASEVAHLRGIGNYGSDAWRLFCKRQFYADHGVDIPDEWDAVDPQDWALRRYVSRRRREAAPPPISLESDELITSMGGLNIDQTISTPPTLSSRNGIIVTVDHYHSLHIPQRIWDEAEPLTIPSEALTREGFTLRGLGVAA